jgi:hypothetical protein
MVVLFQPFSDDELSLFDGCKNVRSWLPAQVVDATQALNLSAGVWNPKV